MIEHLPVITHQIVRGASYRHPLRQQPHFQFAQVLFTTAIGVGDQRVDKHAAFRCPLQRVLQFFAIEAKDGNLNALLRSLDTIHQRFDSVFWLNNQFHGRLPRSLLPALRCKTRGPSLATI